MFIAVDQIDYEKLYAREQNLGIHSGRFRFTDGDYSGRTSPALPRRAVAVLGQNER